MSRAIGISGVVSRFSGWRSRLAALALLVVSSLPGPAQAKTMDFEFLQVPTADTYSFGNLYVEDGFMLLNAGPGSLSYYGTLAADFAGSVGMFASSPASIVTLAAVNGRMLSLKSIALAPLVLGSGPAAVTFTGYETDGGVVSQTFNVGPSSAFTTFTFGDEFKRLSHVQWSQSAVGHQFDNIEVKNGPEPSSAALILFIGLVGIPLATGRWMRHAMSEETPS